MYHVINPNTLFRTKTYANYLVEFWKWLYSVNCDRYNVGDVVFLRGVTIGTDAATGYIGGPVINAADNALTISKEQGVFFCNITTNTEAIYEREQYSEAQLRGKCIADLNQSTIPTEKQILIDGTPIVLHDFENNKIEMNAFRTITSEFLLTVPDTQYGESVAPYMDVVLHPGQYRCVASAYCFLVVFDDADLHTIYSIGKGRPWERGDYLSELLYEIDVKDTTITRIPPKAQQDQAQIGPRFLITKAIYSELEKLKNNKQIDNDKLKFLKEKIEERNKI
jgi:hypothetical protein